MHIIVIRPLVQSCGTIKGRPLSFSLESFKMRYAIPNRTDIRPGTQFNVKTFVQSLVHTKLQGLFPLENAEPKDW